MYLILVYLLFGVILFVKNCRGRLYERALFYREITLYKVIIGILTWPLILSVQLRWYLRYRIIQIKRKIKQHKK